MKKLKKKTSQTRSPRGVHRKPEQIFSLEEANSRLYDIFHNHGFDRFPHAERLALAHFYRLLMTHQLTDNVTRLTKFRDIAIKHFIDSLVVAKLAKLTFPLLDMGTGPGFPGVPLKIVYPNEKIILAEGVRRRVDFLKAVRDEMKLENLDVIGRNITEEFAYPVAGVITRAVEEISASMKNVSQCLKVGGKLFLMKGPNVDAEKTKAKKDWGKFFVEEKDIAYTLPNTPHKRRLLVYRKTQTPDLSKTDESES